MGACSSVEAGNAGTALHITPVPDGSDDLAKQQQAAPSFAAASNTVLPQSYSPSIAATSVSASASASDPQLCSSSSSDTRSDMRSALAILTSPPSSARSNRQSRSAALDSPHTTVRLTSLTLETEGADESSLLSPHSAAAGAVSSRRATGGEGTIIQVRRAAAAELLAPADSEEAAAPQHRSLSPKAFALNSRRQEQVAAEEQQSRAQLAAAQQAQTEQQTQPAAHDGSSALSVVPADSEVKRDSAFFKPQRRSLSKRKQRRGSDRQLQTEEKRLTLDSPLTSVVNEVAAVETPAANAAAAAPLPAAAAAGGEGKRLSMSSLFPFNLKKSASVDLLSLPAAPIASARVSSETAILDVIRSIGQQHTVSVNTLSQYTRCMPPTLAGPAPRSPRISFSSSSPAPAGPLPCCAKLHCPGCGMDVMMLDHHRWVDGVRRETFAASYPDVNRLRSSLQPSVGSRAYCCACSWCDVKSQMLIGSQTADKKISWICAGHQ